MKYHFQKTQLRQKLLQLRQNLTENEVKEKSRLICQKISELEVFQNAQHILFYYPQDFEVDLLALVQKYPEKNWYLPQLQLGHTFVALPFHSKDSLKKNRYGIFEPIEKNREIYDPLIELSLIPGLAFDLQGNRLGRGKGYYDRYFQKWPQSKKVGIAFNFQILSHIPNESYDIPVNQCVSDEKILKIS